MEAIHRAPYFAPRAKPVCHLVFLSFQTYASKVGVFCRDDLDNGKSENTHSNARIKFQDQIYTIRFPIFNRRFRSFTINPTKRANFHGLCRFLHVEIIKMKIARKVSRHSLLSTADNR